MPDSSQKTPIARTINSWAQQKILNEILRQGLALPAEVIAVSGSIVTVKFKVQSAPNTNSPYVLPPVTIPIAGAQWARAPTQIGDTGVCIPADTSIGGITGLGTGTPPLSLQANLASVVFLPVGSSLFSPTDNPNAWVLYGPDGVILRDSAKTVSLSVNAGTVAIVGTLTVTGTITWGFGTTNTVANTHTHGGIQTGSSQTDPPTAGS